MKPVVKLPIGIEDFEKLRTEGFYYVDKTGLIIELLNNWGEVNLFTRPRRFGKSLNMNTLKYFFSYGCDPRLFDGLAIAKETGLCEKYMGRFPVISITLKDAEARSYQGAVARLCAIIGEEALNFRFLLESAQLSEDDKKQYAQLTKVGEPGQQMFLITEDALAKSLRTLSRLLCKHYGQKVILLIDEYDVPLDKAQQYGYYDEMVSLIRSLLGQALKTNPDLQFAVLTGCLPGLLSHRRDWVLRSNAQSGTGYSDILIRIRAASVGIVIELKYSESPDLEPACLHALKQIEEKDYAQQLIDDGMTSILKYGIACRRNMCMVKKADI